MKIAKIIGKIIAGIILIITMVTMLIALFYMVSYGLGIPELKQYPFAHWCYRIGLLGQIIVFFLLPAVTWIYKKVSKSSK